MKKKQTKVKRAKQSMWMKCELPKGYMPHYYQVIGNDLMILLVPDNYKLT